MPSLPDANVSLSRTLFFCFEGKKKLGANKIQERQNTPRTAQGWTRPWWRSTRRNRWSPCVQGSTSWWTSWSISTNSALFSCTRLHGVCRTLPSISLFTGFCRVYPSRLLQFDVISFFTNSFFLSFFLFFSVIPVKTTFLQTVPHRTAQCKIRGILSTEVAFPGSTCSSARHRSLMNSPIRWRQETFLIQHTESLVFRGTKWKCALSLFLSLFIHLGFVRMPMIHFSHFLGILTTMHFTLPFHSSS